MSAEQREEVAGRMMQAAGSLERLAVELDELDEGTARALRDVAESLAAAAARCREGRGQPPNWEETLAAERAARREAQREVLLVRGANRELRRLLAAERVRATTPKVSERYPYTCQLTGKKYRVEGITYHYEEDELKGGK